MASLTLDTTLAELYESHGLGTSFLLTMHCVFAHLDLHPSLPREQTYPEDEEPVPFSADDPAGQDRLRKIILGFKPLRRALGAGRMDYLVYAPEARVEEGMSGLLRQLDEGQRSRFVSVDLGRGDVEGQMRRLMEGGGEGKKKLLFWRPQGWMDEVACLLDPREMWEVNSKKYLLTAGMRTPESEVVDLRDIDFEDEEKERNVFATRPLPFAVKLLRAGCGFGTFLVTNSSRRAKTLRALRNYKAQGVTEVILSAYIPVVHDLSVHFFVGPEGSAHPRSAPLVLGVTVQTLTGDDKWVGGHIDYAAQDALRDLVWDTLVHTTARMPPSFVGWAGIDVVVDAEGRQFVVDLNARFTGSIPICLMAGHFWRERGLRMAQFGPFAYGGRRMEDVYGCLEPLIASGEVVVTATIELGEGDNMADIVWAGKDAEGLAERERWIKERLAALDYDTDSSSGPDRVDSEF